jgi:hypothetical protein
MNKSENLFTISEIRKNRPYWWQDDRLTPAFRGLSRALVCPCCGDSVLHQVSAKVFFRDEDKQEDTRVSIKRNHVTKAFNGENPSNHRDGLRIQFECEQCEGEPELAIVQHKGSTYMFWYSSRLPLIPFDELDELSWTY